MTKRFVPWIVCSVFLLYLLATAVSVPLRASNRFDFARFARLPVSLAGRVQPFDSVARVALSRVAGSASVRATEGGSRGSVEANQWLLDVLARPDVADAQAIFPIGDETLLKRLGLKRDGSRHSYYAFRDLAPKVNEIAQETKRLAAGNPEKRAAWERELLTLQMKLATYERLKNSVLPNSLLQAQSKGLTVAFDFARELDKFRSDMREAIRIADRRKNGGTERLDMPTEQRIRGFAKLFLGVSRLSVIATVPPPTGHSRASWTNTGTAIVDGARGNRVSPAIAHVAGIFSSYAAGNAAAFNDRVGQYEHWLATNGFSAEVREGRLETFYNVFQPFVRAVMLYGAGLVLLIVAWRSRSATAHRSAVMLVLLGFALHTTGLAFAMALGGQPGFANFAGWTVALIALAAGWWRGLRPGTAVAAVIGLAVLVLAFVFTPGGARSLALNLLDIRLIAAALLASAAFGVSAVVSRAPRSAARLRGIQSSMNYLASKRTLRTQ